MYLTGWTLTQLQTFLLIVARVGGVFAFAPVFSGYNIPVQVKAALCFAISLIALPVVGAGVAAEGYPANIIAYSLIVIKEILVGLAMGYAASLFLVAVQFAGSLIDLQMGFAFVNIVDPMANRQITVIGQFEYLLAMLLFLILNGHHWLISAVVKSYNVVPLVGAAGAAGSRLAAGQVFPVGIVQPGLVRLFCDITAIGFKIAAPITVTLLLTDIALGIVARTVPQMNVFIVGFPLKIAVGFIIMIVSLPVFVAILREIFSGLESELLLLLRGA
ncbi:MAG TPA: flagellar type III secretion system protein FliR [Firmicutes bacterium]|nr:flagellar type III secretion system protein FliR [Bacillota bacterium]